MNWTHEIDTWIVVIGVLCSLSCALLGNFLVLRRLSMMGDAISHAVLPGLAVAFLLTGSRSGTGMLLGAVVAGLLTTVLTQWIHGFGRVDRGAAMGVVFTSLFAAGLILIVQVADSVDLDPNCVLYGAIELAPLDDTVFGGFRVPRAVPLLGFVLLVNVFVVVLFYKELKISSFDPALATTLGINANVMHYVLMVLVAVTAVASFEAIGSILVIAMLIVPAAAAHLWTERLGSMIVVSLVIGVASAVGGHVGAITVPGWLGLGVEDTTTSGMMAVVAGLLFGVTVLIAPRHGILSQVVRRAALDLRIVKEDVLGLLYRLDEMRVADRPAGVTSILRQVRGAHPMMTRLALLGLRWRGKVTRDTHGYGLTSPGRDQAAGLIRVHRLWESFLVRDLALPPDHVHRTAENLEHVTSASVAQALDEQTGHPHMDPHGKVIPSLEEASDGHDQAQPKRGG